MTTHDKQTNPLNYENKHTYSLILENWLEIATKLNLYLTKKSFKKFCKDYTSYKEIISINNERFWRKEPIKERKNFEK